MSKKIEDVFSSIPRSPEEMEEIRAKVNQKSTEEVLSKAHKHNERVERAQRITSMFATDEFKMFWKAMYEQMLDELNSVTAVAQIKGSPLPGMKYDPLGQLAQLNNIQGGIEMLASQLAQKEYWEKTAKGERIDVERMKSALDESKKENEL